MDYTVISWQIFYKAMKKYALIARIISSIFITAYYVYSFIAKIGNIYVNIVLASLFCVYTLFQFITIKSSLKKMRKYVRKGYTWAKIFIKTITLGVTIYGLYVASTNVAPISIVLATLMVIIYFIQLALELIIDIIWPKARYVIAGVMKDSQTIIINKLNALGKIKGDDPIELPLDEFEKELKELDPLVDIRIQNKKQRRKENWSRRMSNIFHRKKNKDAKPEIIEINQSIKD